MEYALKKKGEKRLKSALGYIILIRKNNYLSKSVFSVIITNCIIVAENQVRTLKEYCNSLTSYSRRKTREVKIGVVPMGGNNPIRLQSMTTVDTLDTIGTVEQAIRMIEKGCEYVRITAPSINEARNLENIKKELKIRGYVVPLIADIHFTPNAAEYAARVVEKVRINPGNYADKKKFENIEYTDNTYLAEMERIREKFTPLVNICKEYGTAMRIGTNHGSLSDRIMSRYGDTPLGMVESALEFLRICEDLNYYDIVLSMKASNPQVMIQAYRLLVNRLDEENLRPYPLHLGVTEAGEGEDGRIKSGLGIGTLLEDGLGDTIRVSLTEEPEEEIPVARILVDRYKNRKIHQSIPEIFETVHDPFSYNRRLTHEVLNIGRKNVPRVITDYSMISVINYADLKFVGHEYHEVIDKFVMHDTGVDFIYTGQHPVNFMLPSGLKELVDYAKWVEHPGREHFFPLLSAIEYLDAGPRHQSLNFIRISYPEFTESLKEKIKKDNTTVIILETFNNHGYAEQRRFFFELVGNGIDAPVIISRRYNNVTDEQLLLYSSADIGGLLTDGFGDGIFISCKFDPVDKDSNLNSLQVMNNIGFGILQAARMRITRTEYISCPSCGRTLFDLQETTAKIRKRTDHLKGIKIGIMGCIVNGPGEMADADYGYVGSGKGKISLYKGKEVVKKNVPSDKAVDELIELIKSDGCWYEPGTSLHYES